MSQPKQTTDSNNVARQDSSVSDHKPPMELLRNLLAPKPKSTTVNNNNSRSGSSSNLDSSGGSVALLHNADATPPELTPLPVGDGSEPIVTTTTTTTESPSAKRSARQNGKTRKRHTNDTPLRQNYGNVERHLEEILVDMCANKGRSDGVTPKQILDHVMQLPDAQRPFRNKRHMQVQLSRKVAQGKIIRCDGGGRYYATQDTVATAKKRRLDLISSESGKPSTSADTTTTAETSTSKAGRSKRKRVQKTLDPDYVTDEKRFAAPTCDFCLLPATMNKAGNREKLLSCVDCDSKAHPSCLGYSSEMGARCRRTAWQCIECKTCRLCKSAGNVDHLLLCDGCDIGEHMECSVPAITSKPSGSWLCSTCASDQQLLQTAADNGPTQRTKLPLSRSPSNGSSGSQRSINNNNTSTTTTNNPRNNGGGNAVRGAEFEGMPNITGTPAGAHHGYRLAAPPGAINPQQLMPPAAAIGGNPQQTPTRRPAMPAECATRVHSRHAAEMLIQHGIRQMFPVCECDKTSPLPDLTEDGFLRSSALTATLWTCAQVRTFLENMGFHAEAVLFEQQEIDGQALLLLKRKDVLQRLSLRLGPALKLHRRIFALQTLVERLTTAVTAGNVNICQALCKKTTELACSEAKFCTTVSETRNCTASDHAKITKPKHQQQQSADADYAQIDVMEFTNFAMCLQMADGVPELVSLPRAQLRSFLLLMTIWWQSEDDQHAYSKLRLFSRDSKKSEIRMDDAVEVDEPSLADVCGAEPCSSTEVPNDDEIHDAEAPDLGAIENLNEIDDQPPVLVQEQEIPESTDSQPQPPILEVSSTKPPAPPIKLNAVNIMIGQHLLPLRIVRKRDANKYTISGNTDYNDPSTSRSNMRSTNPNFDHDQIMSATILDNGPSAAEWEARADVDKECAECRHKFTDRYERFAHVCPNALSCGECGKTFSSVAALQLHERVHTAVAERPYRCAICTKTFARHSNYKVHVRMHASGRRFFCPLCGKWFDTEQRMLEHRDRCIEVQHGIAENPAKPYRYQCSYCEKMFHHRRDKFIHERVHTGERPYTCGYCQRGFTQSQALTIHIRLHTGEKPYHCNICGMAFRDSSSLRKHEFTKHCDVEANELRFSHERQLLMMTPEQVDAAQMHKLV